MTAMPWDQRWEKVSKLARGGQGETWRVREQGTADPEGRFVLKVLRHQDSSERRARMHIEVETLRVLDNPGVCHLVDANATEFRGTVPLYVVTDFVPGPPLSDYSAPSNPDVSTACVIVSALLSALTYCHSRRIFHRDIKPSNIILRDGTPSAAVLLDFGLSFNEEIQPAGFETDSGQHLGNRFLALPEYATRGADKRDAVSDLASCCGILFYVLTGRHPDVLVDDQGRKPHERAPAADILKRLPEIARDQLTRIFSVGFQQERSRRWQTAEQLASQIQSLSEGGPRRSSLADTVAMLKAELAASPDRNRARRVAQLIEHSQNALNRTLELIGTELGDHIGFTINATTKDLSSRYQLLIGIVDRVRGHHLDTATVDCVLKDSILHISAKYRDTHTAPEQILIDDPHAERAIEDAIAAAFMKCIERALRG